MWLTLGQVSIYAFCVLECCFMCEFAVMIERRNRTYLCSEERNICCSISPFVIKFFVDKRLISRGRPSVCAVIVDRRKMSE